MSILSIATFMKMGGQTVPDDYDPAMFQREVTKFVDRVQEEVDEAHDAIADLDDAAAVDAFLDMAYTAFTGAIRIAGKHKAAAAWLAVCDANLSKVDGRYGPPILDPYTGKIGKPEGWTAPDIEGILYR